MDRNILLSQKIRFAKNLTLQFHHLLTVHVSQLKQFLLQHQSHIIILLTPLEKKQPINHWNKSAQTIHFAPITTTQSYIDNQHILWCNVLNNNKKYIQSPLWSNEMQTRFMFTDHPKYHYALFLAFGCYSSIKDLYTTYYHHVFFIMQRCVNLFSSTIDLKYWEEYLCGILLLDVEMLLPPPAGELNWKIQRVQPQKLCCYCAQWAKWPHFDA